MALIGWAAVGWLGQSLFTARFVVQWLASERQRSPVVPVAFWWFSILGGLALLSYAIQKRDAVFVTGQAMGLFVYVRNLCLAGKARRAAGSRAPSSSTPVPGRPHVAQGVGQEDCKVPIPGHRST